MQAQETSSVMNGHNDSLRESIGEEQVQPAQRQSLSEEFRGPDVCFPRPASSASNTSPDQGRGATPGVRGPQHGWHTPEENRHTGLPSMGPSLQTPIPSSPYTQGLPLLGGGFPSFNLQTGIPWLEVTGGQQSHPPTLNLPPPQYPKPPIPDSGSSNMFPFQWAEVKQEPDYYPSNFFQSLLSQEKSYGINYQAQIQAISFAQAQRELQRTPEVTTNGHNDSLNTSSESREDKVQVMAQLQAAQAQRQFQQEMFQGLMNCLNDSPNTSQESRGRGVHFPRPTPSASDQEKERAEEKPIRWDNGKRLRNPRTIYSNNHVQHLESRFQRQSYLHKQEQAELASALGLTNNQVKIWFQNRRAKEKKKGERGVPETMCEKWSLNIQYEHASRMDVRSKNIL